MPAIELSLFWLLYVHLQWDLSEGELTLGYSCCSTG